CTQLGRAHATGRGVARDASRAAALFTQACDRSDLVGCIELAETLIESVDPPRAVALLERACRGAEPLGCYRLAQLHATGSGVPRNEARAAELDREACD